MKCGGQAARVTLLILEWSDDDDEFEVLKSLALLKNKNHKNSIVVKYLIKAHPESLENS